MNSQCIVISKGKVKNNPESISSFIEDLLEIEQIQSIDQILVVIEHTGLYVNHLVRAWTSASGKLSLVAANKISFALEGTYSFEEKTDEMDAHRIAEYAVRFEDKLKIYQLSPNSLIALKLLRAQRKRMLKVINILEVPVNEIIQFETRAHSDLLIKLQDPALTSAKASLKNIDKEIKQIINVDLELNKLFNLICSVPGVGKVIAVEILIATNGFTEFAPNQAKSFARACGVAPLPKNSGKIKRKTRTSKRSNARMKSLLTIGALSLINTKTELGRFYHRKKEEGKEHMSVMNAMRNKIILRVFAVVRNQTMYQRNRNVSLVLP